MVYTKIYSAADIEEFDKDEIRRYCGIPSSAKDDVSDEVNNTIDVCIGELKNKLVYKVCYEEFDVDIYEEFNINKTPCADFKDDKLKPNTFNLGFMQTESKSLSKHLQSCDKIIIFAATIGIEIDRLIAKYGILSPSRAAVFQAIGAERVEALCNAFCKEIKETVKSQNKITTSRFSPGYGDFPLDTQKEIFTQLDCHRKIGLTLNNSMLMSPSKSVTAIFGIKKAENNLNNIDSTNNTNNTDKCKNCKNIQCQFRSI